MSKRDYTNHGTTISGAIVLGLLALCACGLARSATPTSAAMYRAPTFDPTQTQLVMQEPQIVETITCTSYAVHYDAQGYGSVQGAGCVTTGPIVLTRTGTLGGHVTMTFEFNDGSTFNGKSCRVDSHVELATTGGDPWDSYALNCI